MTRNDQFQLREPDGGVFIRAYRALVVVVATLTAPMAWSQDLATLADVRITVAEVMSLAARRPALRQHILSGGRAFETTIRQVLVQRAILKEAISKGWDKRPEIAERIEDAANTVIVSTYLASVSLIPPGYPSEEEVTTEYEQNKTRLFTPWSYRLAQIYVQRPSDRSKVDAAAKRAVQLAAKARESGADFQAIAKAESEDQPSREKGGDIGWVFESNLRPELRGMVQRLRPGEIGGPVPTVRGWHIVKLLESRPPAAASLEEAKGALVNGLRTGRVAKLRRDYVDALIRKSQITIDQEALASLREELRKQR